MHYERTGRPANSGAHTVYKGTLTHTAAMYTLTHTHTH